MIILGINFYGHDAAAAIIRDGIMLAAVEEERFSRKKHDGSIPVNAVKYCLKEAGITINDVDIVAVGHDFERLFKEKYLGYTALSYPKANALFLQGIDSMKFILDAENLLRSAIGYSGQIKFLNHHKCHLASAFFLSGFDEAACVSVDGLGDIEASVIGFGDGADISMLESVDFPNSLGLLYTAVTYYLGFSPNSAEGTVMALASFADGNQKIPNGSMTYNEVFADILKMDESGKYYINFEYFNFPYTKDGWVSEKFISTFGSARSREDEVTDHHRQISAALQNSFENAYLGYIKRAAELTNSKNLALAGGCALNCVANGRIMSDTSFEKVYIQPGANDGGCALGAAFLVAAEVGDIKRSMPRCEHTYWGPYLDDEQIEQELQLLQSKYGYEYEKLSNPSTKAAELLHSGKIIGWFQGRMEFGPRALGNRSILSAPFPQNAKDRLNIDIKHREAFRPFAPAVLEECLNEYFDANMDDPFMLMAFKIKDEKLASIPAVAHVDNTGRIQTVKKDVNPKFYALIEEFKRLSGVGVVVNTSFNDKAEPIVTTVADTVKSYYSTGLDALIIGSYLVKRV